MINWNLTRSEAEYVVDLLEKEPTKQAEWLAAELRKLLGMQKKEDDGKVA